MLVAPNYTQLATRKTPRFLIKSIEYHQDKWNFGAGRSYHFFLYNTVSRGQLETVITCPAIARWVEKKMKRDIPCKHAKPYYYIEGLTIIASVLGNHAEFMDKLVLSRSVNKSNQAVNKKCLSRQNAGRLPRGSHKM